MQVTSEKVTSENVAKLPSDQVSFHSRSAKTPSVAQESVAKSSVKCYEAPVQTVDAGVHRRTFVGSTRSKFYKEDSDDDDRALNGEVYGKVKEAMSKAKDPGHLQQHSMPKVCQGMQYTPPVIATHDKGPKHENAFQIPNDAHSKSTNNGFSRVKENGLFFCH